MTTVDVVMLGPAGAGKTTLLASIYSQFSQIAEQIGLVLRPEDDAHSAELSVYRDQLEKMSRQLVVRQPGISGTRAIKEYTFRLEPGDTAVKSALSIRFTDYPGGWLSDPRRDLDNQLPDAFERAQICVVAIDTPALMAESARWHVSINSPHRVADAVVGWAKNHPRKLLLLVVRLRIDLVQGGSSSFDLGDDVFGCRFPDERFGVGVPVLGPGGDGVAEVTDAGEHTAA